MDGAVESQCHQSEQEAAQEELPKKFVGINKEESDHSQQTFKVKWLVSLVVVGVVGNAC